MKLKTILAATASVLATASMATGAALADDDRNNVQNTQSNWAEIRAKLNAEINDVNGAVTATNAAIANSMTAEVTGGSYAQNIQYNRANISAETWAEIEDISGAVNVTTAALGNSASIDINGIDAVSTLFNAQNTRGRVTSELGLELDNVGWNSEEAEALAATSAAIGNSFSAEIEGNVGYADNRQLFNGLSMAEMYAHVDDVHGDVSLTTAALGNSANITAEGDHGLKLDNWQATGIDPTALSNITATDVYGDMTTTTAALGNSLSVSTLPQVGGVDINSVQLNNAATRATANVDLRDIAGDAAVTAAAIGNSVNISGLPN